MIAVTDISTLKSLDILIYADTVVEVTGYYTPSDGGGGRFYYNALSTSNVDGGTVIAPDIGSGRWERLFDGVMNVKWFGAKGDGVTDDTDALQRATKAASRKTLFVPKGNYLISDTIYLQGSIQGESLASTAFLLADEVEFIKPAIVITGVGYTADENSFSVNSAFIGTPTGNACNPVLADMITENRSCNWGADIGGFWIRPKTLSQRASTVTQNGLLVQQIGKFNIHDIRINDMNGFGWFEDSTQDAVFYNIACEKCGSADSGKQTYSYIVDSITDGGFNSASRVHHFYVQNEVCTWGAFYTGPIGSRGAGKGGSAENGWYGTHQEANPFFVNHSTLCGLLDAFVHCTIGSQTLNLSCGRNKFEFCDFAGVENIQLGINGADSEVNFFSDCTAINNATLRCGMWNFSNSSIGNLSFEFLANGRVILNGCSRVYDVSAANAGIAPNGLYVNSGTSANLKSDNGNLLYIYNNGGLLTGENIPNTFSIEQTGGAIRFSSWNYSYQFGTFTGVVIDAPVELAGGVVYTPVFTGCTFQKQPFLTSGQTGARFTGCIFEKGINIPLTGTAVGCTVVTGMTFAIGGSFANCFSDGINLIPIGQGAAIPNVTGGVFIDVQARTAINNILAVIRNQKIIET